MQDGKERHIFYRKHTAYTLARVWILYKLDLQRADWTGGLDLPALVPRERSCRFFGEKTFFKLLRHVVPTVCEGRENSLRDLQGLHAF